ncbi:hypothetical protein BTO21_12070 [Photobacterium phosphoreum]|nr:hypothetical protein BTO21_12070 [Photobacterium phosphoreum]
MNPRPSSFKPMIQIYFSTDEKKPESFDSGFLMAVAEEQGSNIREPPTLWSAIPNIRDAPPNYALHHFLQTKKNRIFRFKFLNGGR